MVINVDDTIFGVRNLKPKSFYKEFYSYNDWIIAFYEDYTLEECINRQINIDKMIDANQFEKDEKFDTLGLKGFIIEHNSYEENKKILNHYKQNQILFASKYGEDNPEAFELFEKLINKCEEALKRGYLISNQLLWLEGWLNSKDSYLNYK